MGSPTDSSIDDIAFLTRSEHRVSTLAALTVRPCSRSELWEMAEVSSSTIRRTLREFEQRNWIRKTGYQYEATQLGAYIAAGVMELIDRVENERKLRDVWHLLSLDAEDLQIGLFADAVVTVAESTDPYRPVDRFASLLETADRFRLLGSDLALFEPCRELFRQRAIDGMEAEIIDPPYVTEYVQSNYPDHASMTAESSEITVWIHEELPEYGLSIFDDRVGITGYEPNSGTVRVFVDTEKSEVREWADTTFRAYQNTAQRVDGNALVTLE